MRITKLINILEDVRRFAGDVDVEILGTTEWEFIAGIIIHGVGKPTSVRLCDKKTYGILDEDF